MFASEDIAKLITLIEQLAPTLASCASLSDVFASDKFRRLLQSHDDWAETRQNVRHTIAYISGEICELPNSEKKDFLDEYFRAATKEYYAKTPARVRADLTS